MKKRSGESYKRKSRLKRPTPFFIIVCEGLVTEEDYFKCFPYYHSLGHGTFSHKAVHIEGGAGQHTKVVERADLVYKKYSKELGTIRPDEVWCVFDCDNDLDSLKKAVRLADSKGFKAIYSIQCFELWYVMHFQNLTSPVDKKEYDRKIDAALKIRYTHGTRGMYDLLLPFQEVAIQTAERIWNEKYAKSEMYEDAITNVHTLVTSLNEAYLNLKRH
ncbi:RloB family protein [Paenibacillus sp. F6_3S_P_1C]|uniref:RloB family protein n=1 Tax=Paenibacillus vandeheii TaxID=3035917 RepID=A0ABT8JIV8_9BACL|nr:RloB family protein [Paenibacillus vandeheii]MDN4605064.1 RloB family protein [Paenibacillus vandeheii]